jgi:hypothetical protein
MLDPLENERKEGEKRKAKNINDSSVKIFILKTSL